MQSAAAPRGADDPPADMTTLERFHAPAEADVVIAPAQLREPGRLPPDPPRGSVASDRPRDFTTEQIRDLHGRLAAGDPSALAEIHTRYARYLTAVAAQVTADREAAVEVTQDVLVHLWEHPLRFDPDRGSLRAYLVVIARRRAVDWVRRERARRPSEAVARELAEVADDPAAETKVLSEFTAAIVRRGVADLPHPLRQAVELAFFDGCTYREVAARLTIPEGTAKSRIRAALQKLAARLEREGVHA